MAQVYKFKIQDSKFKSEPSAVADGSTQAFQAITLSRSHRQVLTTKDVSIARVKPPATAGGSDLLFESNISGDCLGPPATAGGSDMLLKSNISVGYVEPPATAGGSDQKNRSDLSRCGFLI